MTRNKKESTSIDLLMVMFVENTICMGECAFEWMYNHYAL